MSFRLEKFASNLKHCLAEIMLNDANDPSFKRVTIVQVTPSSNLKKAVIYVSSLKDIDQIVGRLNKACGFFRKSLAGRLYVKFVPELIFTADQKLLENEKNRSLNRASHEKENC